MHKDLAENGYKVFKGILDTQKLNDIKSQIVYLYNKQIQRLNIKAGSFEDNMIELFRTDIETYKRTGKTIQNLPTIYELMLSPTIMNILEHRCGIEFPVITTKPVCFLHNKNLAVEEIFYKTPPHQDFGSILSSTNGVVVWFSLCDVPESLGPLKVKPKSHLDGPQWSRYDNNFAVCDIDEEDLISLPVELGDMIVFNQMLIHSSGLNTFDNRIRWSINLRYGDAEDQLWQDNGYVNPYEYKSKPPLNVKLPTKEDMMQCQKI